jgi:hypothetical protein
MSLLEFPTLCVALTPAQSHKRCLSSPFWDVIVLTATDEAQAEAYSAILTRKRANHEIPDARFVCHVCKTPQT